MKLATRMQLLLVSSALLGICIGVLPRAVGAADGPKEQVFIRVPARDSICSISLSSDGKSLLTSAGDYIRMWDVETRKEKGVIEIEKFGAGRVAFAPDGKLFAMMGLERVERSIFMDGDNTVGVIKLWESDTLKLRSSYRIEGGGAPFSFSPDGKLMATGGGYRSPAAILWDLETGKPKDFLIGNEESCVMAIRFSPDGRHLLTGDPNGEVRLWNVETGKQLWRHRVGDKKCQIRSLAYSKDGRFCAIGPDHFDKPRYEVQICNATTGKVLRRIELDRTPTCLLFSPDGKILAVGTEAKTVQIFATETGKPEEFKWRGSFRHENRVSDLAFTNDGKTLFSSGYDGLVKAWDLADK